MNPDQTAPWEQSDLGTYCLQFRLPKHKQMSEQTTKLGIHSHWIALFKYYVAEITRRDQLEPWIVHLSYV